MTRRWCVVVLVVLGLQFTVVALYEARHDSLTADEPIYLASGLAALTQRDEPPINCEASSVPKALNAVPLWLAGIRPPSDGAWDETRSLYDDAIGLQSAPYAIELNEHLVERDQLQDAAFLGRLVPILETLLIGLGLFVLGHALGGRAAGLLAAVVWLTTPLVVGLGHLNGLDITFTLAVVWSAVALERYLRAPSGARLAWLAVAAGGLLLARHTGLLVLGTLLVGVVVARWGRPKLIARDLAVVLVGAWALVWGATAIATPEGLGDPIRVGALQDPSATAAATDALLDVVPLPSCYEGGFRFQTLIAPNDSPGFLFGSTWRGPRWWYWPGATAVKLPLPALALVVLGLFGSWRLPPEHRRRALLAVGLPAALLILFLLPFPKPVGVRYLLPALALLLALGAALLAPLLTAVGRRRTWAWFGVGLALLVQVVSLWDAVPHSIAWTAPPFRPGYAVVSESNVDWGQDAHRLAEWMEGRDVAVAYFGGGMQEVVAEDGYRPLVALEPADVRGWVAASVSMLTTYERDRLAWLRGYCHVDEIGGSILLYRFDEAPTEEPGHATPAGPCPSGSRTSSRP